MKAQRPALPRVDFEEVARLARQEAAQLPKLPDVSHCGCALPAGWFGGDGFHYRRADAEYLYTRARRIFFEERRRRGMPDLLIVGEWDGWVETETSAGRMVNGMHEVWTPSLGAVFAMERCPPYMEAYRKSLEGRKRAQAQEKRGKRLLGEEAE